MRLIALCGSLALSLYIGVVVWLTSINISRYIFSSEYTADPFWNRQLSILLWPLMIISEDGRKAMADFWKKEEDQ